MKIKTIHSYFGKLFLCGMAFMIGLALDGAILHVLGFLEPSISISAISNIIWLWFLPGSVLLAFILSFLAQKLQVNWLVRWIVLFEIAWVFSIVGTGVASFIFISTGPILAIVISLFMLFTFLIPLLLLSAMVAALFQTTERLNQMGNAMSASNLLMGPVENLTHIQWINQMLTDDSNMVIAHHTAKE